MNLINGEVSLCAVEDWTGLLIYLMHREVDLLHCQAQANIKAA
jgi:hypothetical protein